MSLREQEERDLAEAIRQSLALVQPEGYSFLPTFAERLPKAKICVIGANYSEFDNERWSQIDLNYIGIEGWSVEPDLIPDNPIKKFNWNNNPSSIAMLFRKGPLQGKKFESIIIDRDTFHHIDTFVLFSFFRVQQKFGSFADKFYLEEDVINRIPELKEEIQKLEQDIANAKTVNDIEFFNKKKDEKEDLLKSKQNRMDTVWRFLKPDIVDTIEVVSRRSNWGLNKTTTRFYGYHFKK